MLYGVGAGVTGAAHGCRQILSFCEARGKGGAEAIAGTGDVNFANPWHRRKRFGAVTATEPFSPNVTTIRDTPR